VTVCKSGGCNYKNITAAVQGVFDGTTIEVEAGSYVEGELAISKTLDFRFVTCVRQATA
jgi:hypothetical protein